VKERYVNAPEIFRKSGCHCSKNTSEKEEGPQWHAAHSEQVASAELSGRLDQPRHFAMKNVA
jgi:hypothetical protein